MAFSWVLNRGSTLAAMSASVEYGFNFVNGALLNDLTLPIQLMRRIVIRIIMFLIILFLAEIS